MSVSVYGRKVSDNILVLNVPVASVSGPDLHVALTGPQLEALCPLCSHHLDAVMNKPCDCALDL